MVRVRRRPAADDGQDEPRDDEAQPFVSPFPTFDVGDAAKQRRLLRADLREAAASLGKGGARQLVDFYYTMQHNRITAANQVRALEEAGEPCDAIKWTQAQMKANEDMAKAMLDYYTDHETSTMGLWLKGITGIGPVIAAGLIAHIDIEKAPTTGHIWRYAGLDPTVVWAKGEKRPWNARLKVLAVFKAGESFVKVQNNKKDYYGHLFAERKKLEWERNLTGQYAEQAQAKLDRVRIGEDTIARTWYTGQRRVVVPAGYVDIEDFIRHEGVEVVLESVVQKETTDGMPMLPPAHIHARARRWTVKLFLAHLHDVWYERHYHEKPPLPYPIAHLGHVHLIPPPEVDDVDEDEIVE
jgi:hypothetical protein